MRLLALAAVSLQLRLSGASQGYSPCSISQPFRSPWIVRRSFWHSRQCGQRHRETRKPPTPNRNLTLSRNIVVGVACANVKWSGQQWQWSSSVYQRSGDNYDFGRADHFSCCSCSLSCGIAARGRNRVCAPPSSVLPSLHMCVCVCVAISHGRS